MTSINKITDNRRIAFGPKDTLMSMANIKYPWAVEIHERMIANFWTEKSVGMGKDKLEYRQGKLSEREKSAYDKSLAFVSNLDGIQFHNLIDNIGSFITAPEVSGAIARQAAEEYLHVRAYQTMIEAVSLDPASVYMMFENDKVLADKNASIMESSSSLKKEATKEAFALAVVGNVALEGIYFYSAFLVFYTLARNGKMLASADMIKYINRDEGGTHLDLFTNIHHTFRSENPEVYTPEILEACRDVLRQAVESEIKWGKYIIQGGFLGLTDEVVAAFPKHLANQRSKALGLGLLYEGIADPVPWFESFSEPGGRANFFERKNTEYQAGGMNW